MRHFLCCQLFFQVYFCAVWLLLCVVVMSFHCSFTWRTFPSHYDSFQAAVALRARTTTTTTVVTTCTLQAVRCLAESTTTTLPSPPGATWWYCLAMVGSAARQDLVDRSYTVKEEQSRECLQTTTTMLLPPYYSSETCQKPASTFLFFLYNDEDDVEERTSSLPSVFLHGLLFRRGDQLHDTQRELDHDGVDFFSTSSSRTRSQCNNMAGQFNPRTLRRGKRSKLYFFFWSFVVRSVVSPNSIHLTNSVDSVQFPLLFEHN